MPTKRGGASRASATAWLFDFDNTIARLEPEVDWARGRTVLEPYLRTAGAPEELFIEIPRGNLPLYEAYRARFGAQNREVLVRASEIIEGFELAGVDRAAPLEGAIEMLKAIDGKIAIVTSNSSRTIARWLDVHKLSRTIDVVVGRDARLALKPSPESVLSALKILNAPAGRAVFVGDSEADLLAAAAASLRFIGIAATDSARDTLIAAGAAEIYSSPAAMAIHLGIGTRSARSKNARRRS